MIRVMIPLLLLFLKIVLSIAQAEDNAQPSQLPDGKICLFTCSEWIFKEKVQQFAPSADLLGAGYLSKHKIGFPCDDPNSQNKNDSPLQYQKLWGAVYSVSKEEYDAVLKQSQTEYSVPFVSNEDVFVVKYNEMNCLVVDLGIQPGDHPPWRHFNMKIPNTIEDEAYFNRLGQIGVPQDYIKGLRNASLKPAYHPVIPQDYHPRQNDQQPKRTFDQLPTTRVHPHPHQYDDQPITGQIPEIHDSEIPGIPSPRTPATTAQPNTRKLLPVVANPLSQPQVATDNPEHFPVDTPLTNVHPGLQDVQTGVPKDFDSGVTRTPDHLATTAQPNSRKLLPGVANPLSQPQVITNQPGYLPEDVTPINDHPDLHDVRIAVPKDIDSGVTTTPNHQPAIVITPMKLPGSSTTQPIVAKPLDNVHNQSPIVVPGKHDDSNVILPSSGPTITNHQPKEIDDTIPTKVTGVAHPTTSNLVNPTVSGTSQTPIDDQSFVVITPLTMPTNKNGLSSNPVVGHDYKVQTPLNLQPDDTQQTLVPKTIDDNSAGPKNVPPILLSGPKQQTQVGPVKTFTNQPTVTQQPPKQENLLLTPDTISPPRLPTQAPDLLINPLSHPGKEPVPESLPTSYNLPCDHDVPGSDSGLLTLSPTPDLTTTHQTDSPLLTLNDTPTNPGTVNYMPAQQVNNPTVSVGQSPDKPALLSHQINPNTLDHDNNPNLLQTNTAPNHLHLHPDDDHVVHSIPASFGVAKPVPVFPKTPMFGFDQSHQPKSIDSSIPTTSSDNNPTLISHQNTPNTLDSNNNPNLLQTNTAPNHLQLHPTGDQTVHPIPASFGVPKPAPVVDDKPMFTFDHPDCPENSTPTSYQINPNTLEHHDNPDLLLPNTAPNQSQLHPSNDQTVHSIPATFGVPKPAAVVPDKPMFGFDQSNHPSCTIPATFGISSQPPVVQDKPMFHLKSSPSLLTPKHIDDNDSQTPSTPITPIHAVDQPHTTGLLPNLVHSQNDQPDHLVSQPNNVPLTTSSIPGPTATHQLPNHVDDSHPVQLTSTTNNVPLCTTIIPESSLLQAPNPVVNNANPAMLSSKPDNAPLTTTIPDSHTVQVPNHIVGNDHPVQLTSKPNSVPLDTTNIPESSTLQAPNPVVDHGNPAPLTSKSATVPLTTDASPVTTPHPVIGQDNYPNQLVTQQPTKAPLAVDHDVTAQPANTVGLAQTPKVSPHPVQHVSSPPAYNPSTFMAPNYTPVSPALGYSFAHRYPQYLHNCNYKPPNCYYNPDELIPGFTFGSHIQLY